MLLYFIPFELVKSGNRSMISVLASKMWPIMPNNAITTIDFKNKSTNLLKLYITLIPNAVVSKQPKSAYDTIPSKLLDNAVKTSIAIIKK